LVSATPIIRIEVIRHDIPLKGLLEEFNKGGVFVN